MIRRLRKKQFGMTAAELLFVAAVIAILALMIIPLYRTRAEDARVVVAEADLRSLSKSIMLAHADTNIYFRPQDMDNAAEYTSSANNADVEIPVASWNGYISDAKRMILAGYPSYDDPKFLGPYVAISDFITLGELLAVRPELVGPGRPIMRARSGVPGGHPDGLDDSLDDRIPVDPWGSPYIFFGPGKAYRLTGNESDFGNAVIYSLGPDALPGDGGSGYFREDGELGNGDDLEFIF